MNARMTACTVMGGVLLMAATQAEAGGIYTYDSAASYLGMDDSPFSGAMVNEGSSFWLETFDDGVLNTPGVSATDGYVLGAGQYTDSVDADGNGVIDGLGTGGSSWRIRRPEEGGPTVTFSFDADALGQLPTFAGIVWTDGNEESLVSFEAFDANNNSLGVISGYAGNGNHAGDTSDDTFFGV
ncbi:MAG: hypothetical protein AAF432_08300, partial [Planctomycetota bacterium]